jgi:hypothetical protein
MPPAPPPFPAHVRTLCPDDPAPVAFSICTLVSRPDQYAAMLRSFESAGFDTGCEYLAIDNSRGNVFDAFAGYNAFLLQARGEYVILAHQDLELAFDNRLVLEQRLRELTLTDPDWGVCGNSGGIALGRNAIRITDPHGSNVRRGPFPQRVVALDENFMVARRSANLCLSHDLYGYHMYGPDLCVMAETAGYRCYVIDFHLKHLSAGTMDASFKAGEAAFARKYANAFRSRWLQTSCTAAFLSGSRRLRALATTRLASRLGLLRGFR